MPDRFSIRIVGKVSERIPTNRYDAFLVESVEFRCAASGCDQPHSLSLERLVAIVTGSPPIVVRVIHGTLNAGAEVLKFPEGDA